MKCKVGFDGLRESEAVYVLLFLLGLADAATTQYGLSLGFAESRPSFFPFLATLIFFVTILLLNWSLWDSVPDGRWKKTVDVCRFLGTGLLLSVALSGALNNVFGLLGMPI